MQKYVAGFTKISSLKRTTEVVTHRGWGDPSSTGKSPVRTEHEAVTLGWGVTHDFEFMKWLEKVWNRGTKIGSEVSSKNFKKDILIEVYNERGQKAMAYNMFGCWVSEYQTLPDLDGNAIALQYIKIENQGWEREISTSESLEPNL